MAVDGFKGIFGTFFSLFGKVFGFILGKWKVSIPLIAIGLALLTGGMESLQEKSVEPLIKKVGGNLLGINNDIYQRSDRIIQDQGIFVVLEAEQNPNGIGATARKWWATIKSVSGLVWSNIYFIWWIALLVWGAARLQNNTSGSIGALAGGLLLLFTVSSIYGLLYIYPDIELETGQKIPVLTKLNPFNGWFRLVDAIPYLQPTFTQLESSFSNIQTNNQTLNQTLQNTKDVVYI
jgi:hypothetical protein